MAKLVFGLDQSLDGCVDPMAFAPSPALFRHFIEEARAKAGGTYGRQTYEIVRYRHDDHPEWDAGEHAFGAAWGICRNGSSYARCTGRPQRQAC